MQDPLSGPAVPRPAVSGPSTAVRSDDSAEWPASLRATGQERELAIDRLHALLLRAARFETGRRRPTLPGIGATELDDLAVQAADDACMAVLARLDTFRGASRFTTWAYKFAIYETSVKLRRRAWRDREVHLEPESWDVLPDGGTGPHQEVEHAELLAGVREGIAGALTAHQRNVLVALALNGVPIDVLADRLGTTRGALYKTLHDARRKLRAHLADRGLGPATVPTRKEAE
ncbi:MAG: RNA polymerase sigma factor [Actinomycetes bacterium]